MKRMRRFSGLLAVMLMSGLLLVSCESNANLVGGNDPNDPEDPDIPGNTDGPDKLAEYLVLTDARKVNSALPSASDGQLKISFKDTIYVVKDFPYGARVVVRHHGLYDLTGFYVGVSNGSFYYDVPVVEAEGQDSTDVIYINIGVPAGDEVDYPLTIPINILPHGPDGIPLDEFNKWVTIEDPEGDSCPITLPTDYALQWEWEFTLGFNYAGELFQIDAPGLRKVNRYQTGGCCNEDGSSSTVADDPYCFEKFSDGSPNPRWRSIDVEHYFYWAFDFLWFFDDGTFNQWNHSSQTNYRPSLSNFCTNAAAYDHVNEDYDKYGTHDFTPGADYLNITYNVTDPPVFGKIIGSGELQYTCHSLILTYGREERWSAVFRKFVTNDHNPIAFGEWD